jgi:hypothetical protein
MKNTDLGPIGMPPNGALQWRGMTAVIWFRSRISWELRSFHWCLQRFYNGKNKEDFWSSSAPPICGPFMHGWHVDRITGFEVRIATTNNII